MVPSPIQPQVITAPAQTKCFTCGRSIAAGERAVRVGDRVTHVRPPCQLRVQVQQGRQ